MVWILTSEAEGRAITELSGTPDRVAAIVAGSILEDRLQNFVGRKFQPDAKLHKDVFRPGGPLGSFSVKIDFGYLLGIYSQEARKDLIRIKDIRNEFAHKIEVRDFSAPKVRDLSKALTLVEKHVQEIGRTSEEFPGTSPLMFVPERDKRLADARNRFLLAVMFFVNAFTPIAQVVPTRPRQPSF